MGRCCGRYAQLGFVGKGLWSTMAQHVFLSAHLAGSRLLLRLS